MRYAVKVRDLRKFSFHGWLVDSIQLDRTTAEYCLKLLKMHYCDGRKFEARIFEIE